MISILSRYRIAAAASALTFALVMLAFVSQLEIDNSIASHFGPDDPRLQSYSRALETFGREEVVLLAVHGESHVFRSDRLARTARLTKALRGIDGVARVTSVASLLEAYTRSSVPGIDPMAQLRLSESEGLAGRLVSADGKTSALLVTFTAETEPNRRRRVSIDQIRSVAADVLSETDESYSLGGIGVLQEAVDEAMVHDGRRFVFLSYVIIVVVFLALLRSVIWTLLGVAVVTLANCVTLGVMAVLDRPLTLMAMAVPTLVIVLGVANVIHMSHHLTDATSSRRRGVGPAALITALAFVAWPCLLNAISTAGGFLSLQTASLRVTRDYGLFAAVGILFAYVFSLVGVVLVLPWVENSCRRGSSFSPLTDIAVALVEYGLRHRQLVMTVAGCLALAAVYAASSVRVNTSILNLLPARNSVYEDHRRLERSLGPYLPLHFTVDLKDDWKRPQAIGDLMDASAAVERDAGSATTVADLLREVRRATTGRAVAENWRPSSSDQIDAYLSLAQRGIGGHQLTQLIGRDGHLLRFTVAVPAESGREVDIRIDRILELIEGELPAGASVQPGGYLPLYAALSTRIASDQISSLSLALLIATVLIGIALRSGFLMLIALPPNLLPIVVMLGYMGASGIFLDLATVTVATSVIGIIVDDTVHVLYRLSDGLRRGHTLEAAFLEAARTSGVAVLTTTIVFCAGFAVLGFASVQQVANVGVLTVLAVLVALLTDLLLLPALVSTLHGRWPGFASRIQLRSAAN